MSNFEVSFNSLESIIKIKPEEFEISRQSADDSILRSKANM